jgi:hypothetical protein
MARITDMASSVPIAESTRILDMSGDYIEDMMGLTQANITALTNNLAHSKGDSDTMDASYDDVMDRLARTTSPFVNSETFSPTDGTSEYSYPTTAIKLLKVIHSTTDLPEATGKELEAYDDDWRTTAEATPAYHGFPERDARKVLLWPTPSTTSTNGGTFIFAEKRTTDIPEWLGIPIALEILSEEMAYPSDHQDMQMADLAWQLAKMLKSFIGI